MTETMVFKPRARLLLQLGDQLIRNESIALLELVKNAYDADATLVTVTMRKVDDPQAGTIIIEDNGTGMNMDIIKNVWMEPGSDYKERLFKESRRTNRFGRLPLGEKGIGRFGAHKCGNNIELITRETGSKEIFLTIDWTAFKASGYLDQIPIEIRQREPEMFKGEKTGTRITIRNLRTSWNRTMVREIYRSINSLCSPFNTPDSFGVRFDIDEKELLKGLLSLEEVKEYALFRFSCKMKGQFIEKFTYAFTPWPSMKKVLGRRITELDELFKKELKMVERDKTVINLSKFKIGTVSFEGLIFDRDPRILSLGVQDKRGLKEYLDMNGGVRVYREGVRVYDYGEPGNDWLNLGLRRVNIPTKRISNNLIIGAVNLTRSESSDLVEKTNREGFIENEAYYAFMASVIYALGKVENLRKTDKDQLREVYGPSQSSEPVVSTINELVGVIEKKIRDEEPREEIQRYLKRIEEEYERMNELLLRSAGAGLTLGVVIHEVEKVIEELIKVVERERPSERIVRLVKRLSELIEGYSVIIRNTGRTVEDLKNVIEQALFNAEYRLESHRIKVVKAYERSDINTSVRCATNLVIGTILNIIDNSIWWLDYGDVSDQRIYLSISDELPDFLCVVIADNGPGFSLPTDELGKPFVSAKPDGMGLGLHIARQVMEAHGGQLLFPDPKDFSVPIELRKGAIVALAFKKEEKK